LNLSVVIASCLNKPEREEYLHKSIESIRKYFGNDIEILIGFDKYGKEIENTKCYIHDKGIGHSWNWGIKESKNEIILQTEDDWIIKEDINNDESFIKSIINRSKIVKMEQCIYELFYGKWRESLGYKKKEIDGYKFYEAIRPDKYPIDPWTNRNIYFYTNHPQIKLKKTHEEIGWYKENCSPPEVEVDMCEKYFYSKKSLFFSKENIFFHIGKEKSRL